MAYFFVHSFASWLYFSLSVLKMRAISGTRGSSGLGSHSREHTESKTLLIVRAGDHWDLRMSRQIDPLELMLGSHSREHTESKTLLIVRAGDHWDLRMSRQ